MLSNACPCQVHRHLISCYPLQALLKMSLPFRVSAEDTVVTPDCILEYLGKRESVIFLSSLMRLLNQTMRICLSLSLRRKKDGFTHC